MQKNLIAAAAPLLVIGASAVVRLAAQSPAPVEAGAPTYSRDVAPIFFKNCTNCHRPGEIAPMSLLTYGDARPWAKAIATQVSRGTMPPWHADPAHGEFLNDRRLSAAEKATILKWVSAGAPEGDPRDLPPAPSYPSGWAIGKPDAVFSMQEDYPIPAEGTIAYQYMQVPTNLGEDKWIQAMEVKPGNPAVVHHVIVFAVPPAPPATPRPAAAGAQPPAQPRPRPTPLFTFAEGTQDIPAGQTGGPTLPPDQQKPLGPNDRPAPKRMGPAIGGFAPGQMIRVYQEGSAMKLSAGSLLVFQMHYTANGTATTDRTRIGVRFATARPQHEVRFTELINGSLHIPAGAADFRVDTEMTVNRDVTVWSMLPHTHVRGKRWEYQVTYPDGRTHTVLAVPKYDFNWQTDYVFKEPLKLPRGTKLHATAWYDNSKNNPSNPDPTQDVWWGDQTWEEMMFTGITFSVDPAPAATAEK
jgi:mono/diheme cytochrome c family protein